MGKDFCLILQVSRAASADEIRSAYRRHALELHPDRSGAASEPFIELQEAYAVLSDPGRREAYDHESDFVPVQREQTPRERWRRAEPFRQVDPAGDFREASLSESFNTFGPSFDEIFDRLWSNFGQLTRPTAERLESLNVDVPLSEEEGLAGGSVRILVPTRAVCPTCRGHGSVGSYECWHCEGQGALTAEYPLMVSYPPGLRRDHVVRLALDELGIHNLSLTVRFCPTHTLRAKLRVARDFHRRTESKSACCRTHAQGFTKWAVQRIALAMVRENGH